MPSIEPLRRAQRRLSLTSTHLALLGAGLVTLALAIVGLLGVGEDVTQHNGLSTTDASHLQRIIDLRSPWLVHAAEAVTNLGSAALLSVLALLVAGVLWWRGSRLVIALAPGLALAIAGTLASVGKGVIGRVRPDASLRLVPESAPSFPSGHATDSTAFYVALALTIAVFVLRRPIAKVLTILGASAAAFAIGVSRLVLGVHWPTDVLAGWLLGLSVAILTTVTAFIITRVTPPTGSTRQHRVAQLLALLNHRRNPTREVGFRAA
ncbi:MAG: undecaprenyl-diphosphatase [Acidimicrobiaceae bacterium]|jgi:undecaprenyl-diphosphatase